MSVDLLYPAFFVFLLMFVGLVTTVLEFKKLEAEETRRAEQPGADRTKK